MDLNSDSHLLPNTLLTALLGPVNVPLKLRGHTERVMMFVFKTKYRMISFQNYYSGTTMILNL